MRKEKERCTQKQPRTVEWEAIATRGEFTHRFGLDLARGKPGNLRNQGFWALALLPVGER